MDVQESVLQRLSALGYTVQASDSNQLLLCADRASEELKQLLNESELPEELFYTLTDMTAGAFLRDKLLSGALDETFGFSDEVKSITEGKTSITYASEKSAKQKFSECIDSLCTPSPAVIARFRRVLW